MIISDRKRFFIRIGRRYFGGDDAYTGRLFLIEIGIGFRPDAPINEIPWRHWWSWSQELPRLIRSYPSRRIIGYSICGRCRIFRA